MVNIMRDEIAFLDDKHNSLRYSQGTFLDDLPNPARGVDGLAA